jgi:hypothetical protein
MEIRKGRGSRVTGSFLGNKKTLNSCCGRAQGQKAVHPENGFISRRIEHLETISWSFGTDRGRTPEFLNYKEFRCAPPVCPELSQHDWKCLARLLD